MSEFWTHLGLFEQVMLGVAGVSTGVFMLRFLMLLFGGLGLDTEDGGDHFDGMDGMDAIDGMDGIDGGDHFAGDHFDGDHGDAHDDHTQTSAGEFSLANYLSIGNINVLLMGMGWGSLWMRELGVWMLPSLILSMFIGAGMVWMNWKFIRLLLKLQSPGSVWSLRDGIGAFATVSLSVPARGNGRGKVMIELGGRLMEIEAIGLEDSKISRNEQVFVAGVRDSETLEVRRKGV